MLSTSVPYAGVDALFADLSEEQTSQKKKKRKSSSKKNLQKRIPLRKSLQRGIL